MIIYSDGSNYLYSRNLDKELLTVLTMGNLGVQMKMLQKIGVPQTKILPMLMPITSDESSIFNPLLLYSSYLFPVLFLFFVYIFAILMTASCFNQGFDEIEGRAGVMRYLGRIVSVFFVSLILLLFTVYYIFPFQDLFSAASFHEIVYISSIFLISTQLMVASLHLVLFRVKILGLQVSVLLGMLSVMVSGATFPLESLPWFMQILAEHLPLTAYLSVMQTILHYDSGLGVLWGYDLLMYQLRFFGILFVGAFFVYLSIEGLIRLLGRGVSRSES